MCKSEIDDHRFQNFFFFFFFFSFSSSSLISAFFISFKYNWYELINFVIFLADFRFDKTFCIVCMYRYNLFKSFFIAFSSSFLSSKNIFLKSWTLFDDTLIDVRNRAKIEDRAKVEDLKKENSKLKIDDLDIAERLFITYCLNRSIWCIACSYIHLSLILLSRSKKRLIIVRVF